MTLSLQLKEDIADILTLYGLGHGSLQDAYAKIIHALECADASLDHKQIPVTPRTKARPTETFVPPPLPWEGNGDNHQHYES